MFRVFWMTICLTFENKTMIKFKAHFRCCICASIKFEGLLLVNFVFLKFLMKKKSSWKIFFFPIDDFWPAYECENNRSEFITVSFHSRQKLNRKKSTFSFQRQEIVEKMRVRGILWTVFFGGDGERGGKAKIGRLDRMRPISRTYFTIRSCGRLSWTNNSL